MKKLISILSFALFIALFSCEKEQLIEANDNNPVQFSDDAPEGPQSYTQEPDARLFLKTAGAGRPLTLDSNLIVISEEQGKIPTLRSDVSILRTDDRQQSTLTCGSYVQSTLYGQDNSFSNSFYANFGLNANLNGADKIYYLHIDREAIVTIDLAGARSNLAMLLLRGGFDCEYGHCRLTFEELAEYSSSSSAYEEHLGPKRLRPGIYMIIIDSPNRYETSDFNLRVRCQPVTSCGGYGVSLRNDDFESYQTGNISPQSSYWEKWSPNAAFDGLVGTSAGNNFLKIERKNGYAENHQPDVLLRLGKRYNDRYQLTFHMWVYSNKSAHFNIQKRLTYFNQNNEFGAQIYFNPNGTGRVHIAGVNHNFDYTPNKWMQVKLYFDFPNNRTILYIDGDAAAQWPASATSTIYNGTRQIEAIDFYPYATHSQFFVDNICFTEL